MSVEGRQVEEAMLAVLHTVLLHRSTGKFHYKKEGTYSIGTVGTQDVDCDFIDFTYVRVSSEELDRALRKVVGEFKVGVWHGRWQVHLKCLSSVACGWTLSGWSCRLLPGSKEQAWSALLGEGVVSDGIRSPRVIPARMVLTCLTVQLSLPTSFLRSHFSLQESGPFPGKVPCQGGLLGLR